MEISQVRRRVRDTLERSRRAADERREAADAAASAWERVLETIAVPLSRQIAQALKAEGHAFQVFTPTGAVRLSSEKSGQDFVEVVLETAGRRPAILVRANRSRGREVLTDERAVAEGAGIAQLDEEAVLGFLLDALALVLER